MSVVVSIQVNDAPPLAYITVQRTSRRLGHADKPADVNTYDYKVYKQTEAGYANLSVIAKGDLEHRYGDGALALLRQVCEVADL